MKINIVVKRLLIFVACVSAMVGCSKKEGVVIEGNVEGAKDKMLYIARVDLNGNNIVDSIKLGKDGSFRYVAPRPECFDFYRLQLDKKGRKITVAVDSCDAVRVQTTADHFADSCKFFDSEENEKIAQLSALEYALQKQVDYMIKNSSPAVGETRRAVEALVNEFKQNICKEYIATAPGSASAYYALFLRLNKGLLFNPMQERFDSRCFSAVATSLNLTHPHAARSQHMYNLATKAMRATQPVSRDTIYVHSLQRQLLGVAIQRV